MYLIGKKGKQSEAYPSSVANAASVALANRYLIGATPPTPAAFTSSTAHVVAATNVTRRASGIFVVLMQMPTTLAGNDTESFSAILESGATASGGNASGDWLVDSGSAISISGATGALVMAGYSSGTTQRTQTVVLNGANPTAAPQGQSAIVIFGLTAGPTLLTPGSFFAVAYELP